MLKCSCFLVSLVALICQVSVAAASPSPKTPASTVRSQSGGSASTDTIRFKSPPETAVETEKKSSETESNTERAMPNLEALSSREHTHAKKYAGTYISRSGGSASTMKIEFKAPSDS